MNDFTSLKCLKIDYATEKEAKAALLAVQLDDGKNRREKRCYKCPTCGMWHLTSKNPPKRGPNGKTRRQKKGKPIPTAQEQAVINLGIQIRYIFRHSKYRRK